MPSTKPTDRALQNTRRAVQRLSLRLGATLGIVAAALLAVAAQTSESHFKLTFDKPATKWTGGIALGQRAYRCDGIWRNARRALAYLNESTLWGGGPHNYTNPQAYTCTSRRFVS